MSKSYWIGSVALMLLGTVVALAGESGENAAVEVAPVEVDVEVVAVEPSEYWLGVAVSNLTDASREQLGLAEDQQGVLVQSVVPDSPAEKAGFKEVDVLVKAGKKRLETVHDLLDAVGKSKGKKLAVELIRDGKRHTVTAVPAERPAEFRFEHLEVTPNEALRQWIEKWPHRLLEDEGERAKMHYRLLVGAKRLAALPDDMTVKITKTGKRPAKVVVEQGDQRWEVTEDQLDKLPEKVRPHVERLLGRGPHGWGGIGALELIRPELAKPRFEVHKRLIQPQPKSDLEERLEKMERMMEDLRKSLEELREMRPRLKKQPKKEQEKA